MSKWYDEWNVFCHWCGKLYKSKRGPLQARFCCAACKMAHHRAYKAYVTRKRPAADIRSKRRVTRKK